MVAASTRDLFALLTYGHLLISEIVGFHHLNTPVSHKLNIRRRVRGWNGSVGSVVVVSVLVGRPSLPGLLIGRFMFPMRLGLITMTLTRRRVGNYPSLPQGLTRSACLTLRWPGYVA